MSIIYRQYKLMENLQKASSGYKKIISLNWICLSFLFLSILLSILDLSFNIVLFPPLNLQHISLFFAFVSALYMFLSQRNLKKVAIPFSKRPDPILMLMGNGLDLYGFIDEILDSTKQVLKQIELISSEIEELDQKIHSTNEDMGRIFQIVTQLANQEVSLMDDVGKTSEEIRFMFDVVNTVIFEIDSRNQNMKNLVQMSQTGGEKVGRTNALIKSVSEKADDMLKLIDFINNITKETNLLAINAAIEASHSDSEGKGFAVIADEMKKLAILTSQKAKEINKLMKGNIEDYQYAHKVSEESGDAFQFISSEIHIISGTIAEVVQTISELKSRGGVVIEKAEKLDQSAAMVKDSSGEVYGEIVFVNNTLDSINEQSEKVRTQIKEISKLQIGITDLADRVFKIAQKINSQTDEYLGVGQNSES
jgi:prefoldin subunit 5